MYIVLADYQTHWFETLEKARAFFVTQRKGSQLFKAVLLDSHER